MDAFSHPDVERVTVKKPAQMGYTEIILNVCGFFMDQDPGPILVMQPNVDPMAHAWSKDRLAPMIRDTPALRSKVRDPRSRDSGNTILHKVFPAGHLTCVGANSAAGLASRPIRVFLCDEPDRYPASAGTEGDPIALGEKRTTTFYNRKILIGGTPTLTDTSRINQSWRQSAQHYYFVPCPACGEMQRMLWRNASGDYCLVWDTADGVHDFRSTRYVCQVCGVLIDESEKYRMAAEGEWWHVREIHDGGSRPAEWEILDHEIAWESHVGFKLDIFYSPWKQWEHIAREFVESKDSPELLQVFVNTVLGETWDDRMVALDTHGLPMRRERYAAEVPHGVGILTAAVDVQADRLEVEVKGWGIGQESWVILVERLHGDTERDEVWDRLAALLFRAFTHESGSPIRIRQTAIDSGFNTQAVYRFVKANERRGVFATKGHSERGKPLLGRPTRRRNRFGVRVWPIGTDTAKDLLFARLKVEQPGPRYMHFADGVDDEFFEQFASERPIVRIERGMRVRKYIQVADRNEAIDLEVLNVAALYRLGPSVYDHLDRWVNRMTSNQETEDVEEKDQTPASVARKPIRRRRRRGWVDSWRK